MYDKFWFVNVADGVVDFLMDPVPPAYMCLTAVHYEIVAATTDRDRMEANASWPAFTYYKRLLTTVEVDILADSPDDFHTFWHTTLQTLMVAPTPLQTDRIQGNLVIRPAGVTEDWNITANIDTPPSIPRAGLGPSAGQMTMTFKSFTPYFYRTTSADYVWHV